MSDMHSNDASRLAPGTRLNGIFEIGQLIASGGMGEVYRGHVIETGDAVAIKVMRTDLANNETGLALFRKEASALHLLHHEAIVRYYVFSSDPDIRRHYLAMEFVDGEPLSELLKRGPLSLDDVRILQRRLASALHAAHQHGIIHRDVSPDNVIVPRGDVGRAKIIDFGIARSTRPGDRTVIGSGFAGKYNYVSPEQVGLFGGEVTAKSDIYSLGIVLAQCLTGQRLDLGGSEFAVVEKRRVLPDLSAVDERYRPLLTSMLQPDPKDRPASMAEVAAWRRSGSADPTAVAGATSSSGNTASPGGTTTPGGSPATQLRTTLRRRSRSGEKIELTALVLMALLSCAGVGWYLLQPAIDPTMPVIAEREAERQPVEREAAVKREAEDPAQQQTASAAVAAAEADRQAIREAALEREAQQARREAEERAEEQRKAEQRARQEAAAKAADEERARQQAAVKAAAEEQARQEAAAKAASEEHARQAAAAEAEAQRQRLEREALQREAEERAQREAEERARHEASAKAAAEEQARKEEAARAAAADERARQEAERQRLEREAALKREAEERARQEAVRAAAEEQARQDAVAKAAAEEQARQEAAAKAAAEERVRQEAAAKAAVEERARQEAAAQAEAERQRLEREAALQREAEERAEREAAERARQGAAAKAAAEEQARKEIAAKAAAEEQARQETAAKAAADAERVRREAAAEVERQRLEREAALQREAEERAEREAAERARQEAATKATAEEQARTDAAAKAAGEEQARQEAAAKAATEERARQEAAVEAERQRLEREAALQREAEERARQEAAAKAAAEEQARKEAAAKVAAEEQAHQEAAVTAAAEERARQEAAAKAAAEEKVHREAAAKAAVEEQARKEAAANAAAEARAAIERQMRITRFVNNYEGGDCFFVAPILVEANRTDLDGYGNSPEPFNILDSEFKRANGFEANIGLHQVTLAQCAAVTFLSRTRNQPGLAPNLEITATAAKSGSPLTGSISDLGDRHVELLLVDERGMMQNLSDRLSPGGGTRSFTINLPRNDADAGQPQLLFALATRAALQSLNQSRLGNANEVFARILQEARDTGQSLNVGARYFKLEN
jgi:hypothetical protein